MRHHLPVPRVKSKPDRRRTALIVVFLLAATVVQAGGFGVPTNRAGIGFGNLPDFSGLRFSAVDRGVRHVWGVNVTIWTPMDGFGRSADCEPCRNGSYTGLGLNLLGSSADRMTGGHVGLLGLAVQDRATGIMIGGLGIGGGDLTGVALGGLGVGGDDMTGIFAGGLGVGGSALRGLAVGGFIGTESVRGAALAAVYHRTERLYGVCAGLYNRAGHAEGLMLGLFNRARTLRGVQIGLLNQVGSGPAAARWLPLVNARF